MDPDSDRGPSPLSPKHDRDMPPMLATPHGLSHRHHAGVPSPPSPVRPQIHPGLYPRGSPLPLHLAFDKTVYSSPPQASNKPENNQCHLLDYRGAKVAAFHVERRELICLPQAFELFLKHLVGGLHTVYTKLKRLGITPVVCNVEQVRILRGLGAIQPGVNRCKLIAPKEFDVLYDDCTNSSARPGRPPKRGSIGSPDSFEAMKKSRTEADFYNAVPNRIDPKKPALFPNSYHFPPYHLPFMSPLAHPAMMNLAMANHLGMRPDMVHAREPLPADLSTNRRPLEEKTENSNKLAEHGPMTSPDNDKPLNLGPTRRDPETRPDPGLPAGYRPLSRPEFVHNGHMVGGRAPATHSHDESEMDDDISDEDDVIETDEMEAPSPEDFSFKKTLEAHAKTLGMPLPTHGGPGPDGQPNSAVETLLMNILGLLKVAIENARLMEEQAKHEKSQIKMDLMKEKETREQMEKQLEEEQRHIALLTKKLKRERRAARRLQDQLEHTATRLPTQPTSVTPTQQTPDLTHNNNSEDDLKQAQEDLKKLNEISNRMSPIEDRKSHGSAEQENKLVKSEPSSTGGGQNAMESLIMSTQRLPSSCHGSANGYLHSPIIKQAETV